MSALILAESEGHKLSARELYSMIMLLIVAGHETTVNLITNTVLALENPNQLQLLKDNPKLIDSAIEEGLRYYSPVEVTTARWARNLSNSRQNNRKRRYGCHCLSFCKS